MSAIALCLLACCLRLAAGSGFVELDAGNFHKAIDTNDATLVMFKVPWCGHCQEAKPKFVSAAKALSEPGKVMAIVDCEDKKSQDLCTKQKIDGYPTFKFFSKGKFIQDFEDEPSEKALLDFMRNPPKEGEKRPAAANAGATGQSEGDEPGPPMESVTYLGANNYTETLEQNNFTLVFYYADWCPHCKESKPKYEKAAKELAAKPIKGHAIAAINCDLKDNQKLCESEKVEGYPTIRLMKKREVWVEFEEEIEADRLLALISSPPAEKVLPTPVEEEKKTESANESEEKPEDKMKNVVYLESEEFAAKLKSRPHALVMFYAPWCGHCQQAKPIFDKAAAAVGQDGGKILAAVNCDAKSNEKLCEELKIEGFPTFLHFANGVKKDEYSESPITEKGVVEFMKKLQAGKEEL